MVTVQNRTATYRTEVQPEKWSETATVITLPFSLIIANYATNNRYVTEPSKIGTESNEIAKFSDILQ